MTRGDHLGDAMPSVLVAIVINQIIKINPLLIEINFFLGCIVKLNITLVNHPRPTTSEEAPGGGVG